MSENKDTGELERLAGRDHDKLTDYRYEHLNECKPSPHEGYLICPITGLEFCKKCCWTNSGPCYCDFSYG